MGGLCMHALEEQGTGANFAALETRSVGTGRLQQSHEVVEILFNPEALYVASFNATVAVDGRRSLACYCLPRFLRLTQPDGCDSVSPAPKLI